MCLWHQQNHVVTDFKNTFDQQSYINANQVCGIEHLYDKATRAMQIDGNMRE